MTFHFEFRQLSSTFVVRQVFYIFLLSLLLIGCQSKGNPSTSQNLILDEFSPTPVLQSETITPIIESPTATPILSTPSPATLEPTIVRTPEITNTPNFETERVFNFGAERIYNAWGERITISPDEQWLAVITVNREIGSDGSNEVRWEEVRLYNYEVGKQQYMLQRTVSAPQTYITMAFSPDSKWLTVAGTEQIIWVWDLSNGQLVHQLSFWGPVVDLVFSPDGRLLAAVSPSEDPDEYGVGIFDIETEALIAQMREREATSVTFLENDVELLIGAAVYYHPDREVRPTLYIWDYEANTITDVISQYGVPQVIALNQDKELFATVIENRLHLIEIQSHAEITVEMPEFSARALSFDNAGNLWALGFDGLLSQWNADGQLIRQQQFADATDFAVMPKTNHLLISFPNQILQVSFNE